MLARGTATFPAKSCSGGRGHDSGGAFGRTYPAAKDRKPVLPDFLIRAQAAALNCRHLTNDRRRLRAFPQVDYIFPDFATRGAG